MEQLPDKVHPKFELGSIVATPGALELLERAGRNPLEFIIKHISGDWGQLDDHDRLVNESALLHGGRLLSSYVLEGDERLWCITETDRSSTCLLLPQEY
jgi:hypothetical protein